jgi:hypothetical protein
VSTAGTPLLNTQDTILLWVLDFHDLQIGDDRRRLIKVFLYNSDYHGNNDLHITCSTGCRGTYCPRVTGTYA